MLSMLTTNSPEQRLNNLYEFLRQEPDLLSKEEQDNVINSFKLAKEAKSKEGRNEISKRWDKIKKDKQKGWIFMESCTFAQQCLKCGEISYTGDPCFYDDSIKPSPRLHEDCAGEDIKANVEYYQKVLNRRLNK